MRKLLLMSMLFATIVIPAIAARDPRPQRGLRKTLWYSLAFYVVYWLSLLFIYNRLG